MVLYNYEHSTLSSVEWIDAKLRLETSNYLSASGARMHVFCFPSYNYHQLAWHSIGQRSQHCSAHFVYASLLSKVGWNESHSKLHIKQNEFANQKYDDSILIRNYLLSNN